MPFLHQPRSIPSQIARVDRVLSGHGEHLLLVGRSGVGRREATVRFTADVDRRVSRDPLDHALSCAVDSDPQNPVAGCCIPCLSHSHSRLSFMTNLQLSDVS